MKRDQFIKLSTSGIAGIAISKFPLVDKIKSLEKIDFAGKVEYDDTVYNLDLTIALRPTIQPDQENRFNNIITLTITASRILERGTNDVDADIVETFAESLIEYKINDITANPFEEEYVNIIAKFDKVAEQRMGSNKDLPDIELKDQFAFLENGIIIQTLYNESSIDYKTGIKLLSMNHDPFAELNYDASGCFLTTATIKSKGLSDDCYQLEILRKFRDEYMLKTDRGRLLVNEYYAIAPSIVHHLNKQKNSQAIYSFLYNTLITESIKLIEQKKYETAMNYYKNYTLELKRILSN